MFYPPDSFNPVLLLISLGLLLLCAFVAASEAAFFSLSGGDLDSIKRSQSTRASRTIALLNDAPQLWTTFSCWGVVAKCATIASLMFVAMSFLHSSLITSLISIVAILAIVGDLVPRMLGRHFNVSFAMATSRWWHGCITLSKPLTSMITRLEGIRNLPVPGRRAQADSLSQALALAVELEGVSESDKEILKGIANFGTLTVKQVMRPRSEISAINVNTDFVELMEYVNKSGFSRIPVYDNTLDSILGVLYIKDLLPFLEDQDGFEWQSLLRPGFFVPEYKKIDLLLKEFQEKRVHMAIVMGEYGGTMGLVTLEDLIEEIIGEINDEFDEVVSQIKKIDSSTYIVDGNTSLNDLCKELGINPKVFQKVKRTGDSVAVLLQELNKKSLRMGDQIRQEQFTFTVESVDRRGVKRIRVKIHAQS
jgi:gliding motility-associated protein GldE